MCTLDMVWPVCACFPVCVLHLLSNMSFTILFVRLYLTLPLLRNQTANGTPKAEAGSVSVVCTHGGHYCLPIQGTGLNLSSYCQQHKCPSRRCSLHLSSTFSHEWEHVLHFLPTTRSSFSHTLMTQSMLAHNKATQEGRWCYRRSWALFP